MFISRMLPLGRRLLLSSKNSFVKQRNLKIPYGQIREYKNFSHKPQSEPLFTKIFCLILALGATSSFIDWRWCRMLYLYYTGQIKNQKDLEEAYTEKKHN